MSPRNRRLGDAAPAPPPPRKRSPDERGLASALAEIARLAALWNPPSDAWLDAEDRAPFPVGATITLALGPAGWTASVVTRAGATVAEAYRLTAAAAVVALRAKVRRATRGLASRLARARKDIGAKGGGAGG
jgi:hypothetical protein